MATQKETKLSETSEPKRKRVRKVNVTKAPADHPIYSRGFIIGGIGFNNSKKNTKEENNQ